MSYGVERQGRPFNAVTLVDAARGTSRTAHEVLFEGSVAPPSSTAGDTDGAIILVGLPRGDGVTLVDRDELVRDGGLAVIESLVDELRRRGFDARLDRESTLALAPRGISPVLRVSIWLDDIVIRRAATHVEASSRMHVWARGAGGESRWEDDERLHTREDRAPFDVLDALGRQLAGHLAKKLAPPPAKPRTKAEP